MAISGVEPQTFLQLQSPDIQNRKPLNEVRNNEESTNRAKEQSQSVSSSAIQDQVTLSNEAQSLSVSNSQPSKNSTFQQSPSPFDK